MQYKIEEVINISEKINGMKVLTCISPVTNEKRIDGPMNLDDYDKYYEWLRNETNKYNISVSDSLEDFKVEFLSDPGVFIPCIYEENALKYLRNANDKDILEYNSNYRNYFEDAEVRLNSILNKVK